MVMCVHETPLESLIRYRFANVRGPKRRFGCKDGNFCYRLRYTLIENAFHSRFPEV